MLSSLSRSLRSRCFVARPSAFHCRIRSVCRYWWSFGSETKQKLGGCRYSSGKAPRARPVACAGNGVGCVAGEARAGAVVGGAAVVADERPDVGSNRAVAGSAGDSVVVFGVLTEGEGGC